MLTVFTGEIALKKMAIIFTCFNRKDITKRCLHAIKLQADKLKNEYEIELYVCDDGSSDGTLDVLENTELNLTLIHGGSLFWNKGMHAAMQKAVQKNHDFYLMINDDVDFYQDAISIMMQSYYKIGRSCGITGAVRSANTGVTSYGGRLFKSKNFITPNGNPQICNLANWNCFLIDSSVVNGAGIIDPYYEHAFGDYDYSMEMQRKGCSIYVADEFVGECNRNSIVGTFQDRSASRIQRLKMFFSPKGMPIKSMIRYSIKNRDFLGMGYFFISMGAYIKNLLLTLIT